MKVKGFGKKYFALASIQAYSCALTLHRTTAAFKSLFISNLKIVSKKDEEIPLLEDLLQKSCLLQSSKPCHCDCFFRRKTALAVRLFKYIPRCPFYCTFFAFRRTGVHPPFINL
ncbi:hypothetical protein AAX26_00357 [Aliarcobacter thereius]|uniref:Uncharacterized protein n=1 Tax=Aliarcobacter thereius TaxID=544718 RepID=A0A1C0B9A4_9BACT|nr:hypothetical protein [Aliarcobacter thereius]OCL88671.1 hypothetical protein AAX26_00357 [Aliarcobacter thereius]OCM00186.1 hypothetical protein AAX29_00184 [Aliarcobacter thereius]TLS72392.1 hypothetical protein FE246_03125 [Aliarcobacter thereius]HJE03099.1 hypothetical protein [Aliarcobacter thereius]